MKILQLMIFSILVVSCIDTSDPCSQFNPDQCMLEYNFEIEYTCDIENGIIEEEDTFSIRIEIPHIITDIKSGDMYDIEDFNYSMFFFIQSLDLESKEVSSAKPENFDFFEGLEGSIIGSEGGGLFTKANLFLQLNSDSKSCQFNVIAHEAGLYVAGIDYSKSRMVERNGNFIDITDTCCPETINLTHTAQTYYDSDVTTIGDTTGWTLTANGKPTSFSDEDWVTSGIFVFEVSN